MGMEKGELSSFSSKLKPRPECVDEIGRKTRKKSKPDIVKGKDILTDTQVSSFPLFRSISSSNSVKMPLMKKKQKKLHGTTVLVLILEKAILMAGDGLTESGSHRYLYEEKIKYLDGGVIAGCCGTLDVIPKGAQTTAYSTCRYFKRKIRENLVSPEIRKLKDDVDLLDILLSFSSRPRKMDFEVCMSRWSDDVAEVFLVKRACMVNDYECIGAGAHLARPILDRRYARNMTVREGTNLLVQAMMMASRENRITGGWIRVWCLRQNGSLHDSYY